MTITWNPEASTSAQETKAPVSISALVDELSQMMLDGRGEQALVISASLPKATQQALAKEMLARHLAGKGTVRFYHRWLAGLVEAIQDGLQAGEKQNRRRTFDRAIKDLERVPDGSELFAKISGDERFVLRDGIAIPLQPKADLRFEELLSKDHIVGGDKSIAAGDGKVTVELRRFSSEAWRMLETIHGSALQPGLAVEVTTETNGRSRHDLVTGSSESIHALVTAIDPTMDKAKLIQGLRAAYRD
jgi:hypothetical protein